MKLSWKTPLISLPVLLLLSALSGAVWGAAGNVQFVIGDVKLINRAGQAIELKKGAEVNEGDRIVTGDNASAQIKMVDGGFIAVRPNTNMGFDTYRYNGKEDGSESAVVSLLSGGFRTITGIIGRTNKQNYTVRTETSTIGIRGTDHEPMVILPPAPGRVAIAPPGTYDKVNLGIAFIRNEAGTIDIQRNQVGYVPDAKVPPRILPSIPPFYKPTPAPGPQKAKEEAKEESKGQQSAGTTAKPSEQQAASGSGDRSGTMRENAVVDPTASTAIAPVAAPASAAATATAVPAPTVVISATNAAGTTVNVTSQSATTGNTTTSLTSSGTTTTTTTPTTPPTTTTTPVTTTSPTPGSALIAAYPVTFTSGTSSFTNGQFLTLSGENMTLTKDAAGNVTGGSVTYKDFSGTGGGQTYSSSGGTAADSGKDTVTGLAWGRWQGGTLTSSSTYYGQDATGATGLGAYDQASGKFVIGGSFPQTTNLGSSSLHWITGQQAAPGYLAQVVTGTSTYSLIGGTKPTDTLGNVGTLNKASLAANFTAQTVSAGVDFTISSNTWTLQSNTMPLNGNYFNAFSCIGCTTPVNSGSTGDMNTFTKNGAPVTLSTTGGTPYASLSGQLLGTGLNAAALQYTVTDFTSASATNVIQGVAGFSGTAQNIATPYRLVGTEDGYSGNFGAGNVSPSSSSSSNPGFGGTIESLEAPANRVVSSAAGMTEFLGSVSYPTTAAGATTPTYTYVNNATVKIGTAVNKDVGTTTIDGIPISWGRWEGGSVDIYSLDGATKLGTIANASKSIHWITTGTLTGPVNGSLPITGTATYTLVGNTNPTDFKGNVGTLGTATLGADFSKMLMNASITANFASTTNNAAWSMSAANVPIRKSGEFESASTINGVNGISHTATCTGTTCGSTTYGQIGGTFFGTAAAGGVVSYRMGTGTTSTTTTTTSTTQVSPGLPANFTPTNGVIGMAVFKK